VLTVAGLALLLFGGVFYATADTNVTRISLQEARNDLSEQRADIREAATVVREEAQQYREGEIVLKLKGDSRFRVVRLPQGQSVEDVLQAYRGRSDVEYAEPNYIAHAFSVPNDPYYVYQWHLDNSSYGGISYEEARDISTGAGVVVAVVDTGVAYEDYSQSRRHQYYQAPFEAPLY